MAPTAPGTRSAWISRSKNLSMRARPSFENPACSGEIVRSGGARVAVESSSPKHVGNRRMGSLLGTITTANRRSGNRKRATPPRLGTMCGGRGGGRICGHIVIADKAPGAHDATMSSYPTRRVAALGFPEAHLLAIAALLEVFSRASRLLSREGGGPPAYVVELLAHKAGPVVTSSGLALIAARAFSDVRGGLDTLVVSGGRGTDLAVRDRSLIAWLRRMAPRV